MIKIVINLEQLIDKISNIYLTKAILELITIVKI